MKKSLLALAVLGAFAGAASAQSSVTIYGKIDLGVAKVNEARGAAAAPTGAALSGASDSDKVELREAARSRLGFRGTEDLGAGLKANFNIEHSFRPDEGTQNATPPAGGFWSQSWLGLSGGFGEVRLGRDYSPVFYSAIMGDPFGFDTVGQAGPLHNYAGVATSRHNNQISYKTPSFAGVTAMVAFSPREGAAGKNSIGANVMYSAGPLALGFGFENSGSQTVANSAAAATTTGVTENKLYVLTAAYDLGFVRPIVQFSKGTADAGATEVADNKNWLIGATAPLGGGDLKVVYTQLSRDIATAYGAADEIKKFGLGYHYPLSKRTKVYADVGTAKEDGVSERRTAVDFGVQHNF